MSSVLPPSILLNHEWALKLCESLINQTQLLVSVRLTESTAVNATQV